MKKLSVLALSFLTAGFLVGCGGGGSSSDGTSTNSGASGGLSGESVTSTDVTVERGAVYNSVVTDANGQIAIQKDGQNVYTFAITPVYPITVTGGVVDVDGNGIDEGDIELFTPLTSYSNIISPITDYLGDTTSDSGKIKLAKLKEISGATDDELLKKAPSVVGKSELLALTNAIFSIKNDDDSTNDDFISSYNNSAFKTKFEDLKLLSAGYSDKKEMAKALEEKVVDDLQITKLSSDEAQKNKAETRTTVEKLKFSDIGRMVSFEQNDYYSDGTIDNDKSYQFKYNNGKYEWVLDENNNSSSFELKKDETNSYKAYLTNLKTNEQWSETIVSTKKIDSLNGASYTDLYKTTVQYELIKEGNQLDWYRVSFVNPSATTKNNEKIVIVDIDSFIKVYTRSDVPIVPISFYINDKVIYFNEDGTLVNGELKKVNNGLEWLRATKVVGSWKKDGDQIIATSGNKTRYFRVVLDNGNYYIEDASLVKLGTKYSSAFYTGKDLDLLVSNIKSSPILNFINRALAYIKQIKVDYIFNIYNDDLPVTYSLSGEDANKFNIDSTTGTITFKQVPDYETSKKTYTVYVVATNSKNQMDKGKIEIKLISEPKFKYSHNYITHYEGRITLDVETTVMNPIDVIYSLDGEDAEYFNIDSKTGKITFKLEPDYESGKILYNFYVVASNKSSESSKIRVRVEIKDLAGY